MKTIFKTRAIPVLTAIGFAITTLISACGGGGGGSSAGVPTTPTTFTAIDGLLKGAIVCVDGNNNGTCDAGETQGTTDASGVVTLNVPTADIGKYPTLVIVPAGAVDADDPANPIVTSYMLKAPADNPSVITPLTTLVQHQVENGLTSAQAATAVQDQTGVANAFANFIATPDANARVVAKTIVQITQAKLADTTLTAIVGTNDPLTGKPITQADLNAAIRAAILQTLPSIVAAVNTQSQTGGACVDPTAATCKAAIAAAVTGTSGLAAGTGITAANLGTLVGIAKSTSTQTEAAPIANATLKWLKYTDASNWYYRIFVSSLAENTFDANNLRRYRDIRATDTAGVVANAGGLVNQGRTDDLHWNGSAWVAACNNTWQNTQTTRDANGVANFNYCDNYLKGTTTIVKVDYSGKSIADMVTAVRSYPSQGDGLAGVGYAGWGSSDNKATTALASGFASTAALPNGASLYYVTTTPTEYALSYIVSGPAAQLTQTSTATAAGGDATNGGTPTCSVPANQAYSTATSLSAVIAQNQGTPCKFGVSNITGAGGVSLTSGSSNEWWDASTLDIGTIGSATTSAASAATSFYTANTKIRVAFPAGAGQVATFYACQQRYDGSARNCTAIGTGAYTMTTLGDAKVLAFTGVPAQAAPLTYARAFVERAGVVRYGFIPKLTQTSDVRPNLAATNALFNVLGIPAVTP
jgi:trimeric autotransporter adhesin